MSGGQWHLDKRIPLSLIATLIVQMFFFGWVAKTIDGKTEANSLRIAAEASATAQSIAYINREMERRRTTVENNATSVAVLASQLAAIKESQDRMLEILEGRDK